MVSAAFVRGLRCSCSEMAFGAGVNWKLILDVGMFQMAHYLSATAVGVAGSPSAAGMLQ